jgi:hypothetical protein
MPKGQRGEKEPADAIANVVKATPIVTGEEEDVLPPPNMDCTKADGRQARRGRRALTPEQRMQTAGTVAQVRGKKSSQCRRLVCGVPYITEPDM